MKLDLVISLEKRVALFSYRSSSSVENIVYFYFVRVLILACITFLLQSIRTANFEALLVLSDYRKFSKLLGEKSDLCVKTKICDLLLSGKALETYCFYLGFIPLR